MWFQNISKLLRIAVFFCHWAAMLHASRSYHGDDGNVWNLTKAGVFVVVGRVVRVQFYGKNTKNKK